MKDVQNVLEQIYKKALEAHKASQDKVQYYLGAMHALEELNQQLSTPVEQDGDESKKQEK